MGNQLESDLKPESGWLRRMFNYVPSPFGLLGWTLLELVVLFLAPGISFVVNLLAFPLVLYLGVVFLCIFEILLVVLGIKWGITILRSQLQAKTTTWTISFVLLGIPYLLLYDVPRYMFPIVGADDQPLYALAVCLFFLVGSVACSVTSWLKYYRRGFGNMLTIATPTLLTICATLFYFSNDIQGLYALSSLGSKLLALLGPWRLSMFTVESVSKCILCIALLWLTILDYKKEKSIDLVRNLIVVVCTGCNIFVVLLQMLPILKTLGRIYCP